MRIVIFWIAAIVGLFQAICGLGVVLSNNTDTIISAIGYFLIFDGLFMMGAGFIILFIEEIDAKIHRMVKRRKYHQE